MQLIPFYHRGLLVFALTFVTSADLINMKSAVVKCLQHLLPVKSYIMNYAYHMWEVNFKRTAAGFTNI